MYPLDKFIREELPDQSIADVKKEMHGIKILPFDFDDLGTKNQETFYLASNIPQIIRKIYSKFGKNNAKPIKDATITPPIFIGIPEYWFGRIILNIINKTMEMGNKNAE